MMTGMMVSDLPEARSIAQNPAADELRELTERMPTARLTEFKNVNVTTQVLARCAPSTFIVSETPIGTHQVMPRDRYDAAARQQDEFIADADMLLIEGYIGDDPEYRVAARLYIESAFANIAGMQQKLFFPAEDGFDDDEDVLTVIYTPSLAAPGFPDDRLIAVDLDNHITRVMNSDYFGESKKGNLRQWNKLVYERGGLSLHAGAKVVPTTKGERAVLIVGLSGTGKTTTTFTKQNGSLPVQDDFVAWWPNGRVSASEAGCFAKTFGLAHETEPSIHGAVTRSDAYLENVSQNDAGKLDFFDTSYTKNGRAVFGFEHIEHAPASQLGNADILLILNRNENVIPAVSKLTHSQAAAYFMLGETTGTSAGGKSEAGKFLRVPGTNPFFPMPNGLQANRFLELMNKNPLEVYLLNTGRVGGKDGVVGSRKVEIKHSSAIVQGICDGTITWRKDPDFGYETAVSIPGFGADDAELLNPSALYTRLGRSDEYTATVARLKQERKEFLAGFPMLADEVLAAVQ